MVLIVLVLGEKTSSVHPSIHPWNKMLKEQSVVGRLGDASSGTIQMALEESERRCVGAAGCLKMFRLVI